MIPELGAAIPWLPQGTPRYLDSFDANIGISVKEYGQSVHLPSLQEVSCWVCVLHGTHSTLEMHIYKERLADSSSSAVCDQCRIIGRQAPVLMPYMHGACRRAPSASQAGKTILCQGINIM